MAYKQNKLFHHFAKYIFRNSHKASGSMELHRDLYNRISDGGGGGGVQIGLSIRTFKFG